QPRRWLIKKSAAPSRLPIAPQLRPVAKGSGRWLRISGLCRHDAAFVAQSRSSLTHVRGREGCATAQSLGRRAYGRSAPTARPGAEPRDPLPASCARPGRPRSWIEDEIARRGIRLAGNGAEREGRCPKCGGTDRFAINTQKQTWNCRNCKTEKGDVIGLVRWL